MPKKTEIVVGKAMFDRLLKQMLKTPPLPREALRGKKNRRKTAKS
jgi:hypothetical protein